jgi:EAL domain-containing protein (putative c-di-GMP-specific phosphodiesterase class I)
MTDTSSVLAGLVSFEEASRLVVDHLERAVPLAFWSITHIDEERQLYLHVTDRAYGISAGDSAPWPDTFCRHMLAGAAPQVAPDAMAVPAFASSPAAATMKIGTYVGVPIVGTGGAVFGTLCGLDPEPRTEALLAQTDLLHLCAALLGQILQAEQLRRESLDHAIHDYLDAESAVAGALAEIPHSRTGVERAVALTTGVSEVELERPLREALQTGAITAAYQPLVDLRTGLPVGFEALARWNHDGRPVPPDVFVPVAARAGLMPALTTHMLDLGCAQIAAWSAEVGHDQLRIGVNVSPTCVTDTTLPEQIEAVLERHRIEPHQLILEITEDALLRDLETATEVTHRLCDLGVRLSLDDFGTGYSSLLHLRQIPLHSMKIDRAFIGSVATDLDAQRFVTALLNLAEDLGLTLVVEGVEHRDQAVALEALGAVFVQGHLYGMPAPAAEIDPRGSRRPR